MDDQQQREVALGLQQGRPEAWRALYDAYCRQIWRLVARVMGPGSTDVADVVQETFLAAAATARNYDADRGSLWLWLGGIARNHVALHYRKQRRHDRIKHPGDWPASGNEQVARWLENREAPPTDALASAELATRVRATLTQLPSHYETLLTAKYFDGATVQQIADLEDSTSTAVRSKLARARRAFRKTFARISTCSSEDRGGK